MSEKCEHKRKIMGYLQWHAWAEAMKKLGEKQTQCPKCKLWFFKDEL